MKKYKLSVKTKNKKYSIIIGNNIIKNINNILKKEKILFNKCLIIVDNNIPGKLVFNLKKNIKIKKILLKKYKIYPNKSKKINF